MNRWLKIVAIIVVLVLAGTYAMYAMVYKGNYNLDVSVKLNVSSERSIALTEFASSSSPTNMLQFWDQLKGSGDSATDGYIVSWQLTQGTDTTSLITRCLVSTGESKVLDQTFSNVNPGDGTLTITVRDAFGASLHVQTYTVVVG